MNKKVLIIVYRFPPMGGVGARRWAKFAKYLARNGYLVHVITCHYPYHDAISWYKDVQHENILVHRINTGYPSWLLQSHSGVRRKIASLISIVLSKTLYYLDVAQRWGSKLIPYANRLIREEGIRNVIVSGPPSSLHYTATYLKIENPCINLIQDYRDPWNSDRDYEYGKILPFFMQKERSAFMEMFAVLHASKIIVVSNDMKNQLESLYSSFAPDIVTLHNGYDPDDYSVEAAMPAKLPFSLIYTGGLGGGRGGRACAIELLARAIEATEDQYIKQNLMVDIYSDLRLEHYGYSTCFSTIKENFRFHDLVPPGEVVSLISRHSCCLSINAPTDAHAFGTKIFDYMALGKAIFHVSNGGELFDILQTNNHYVAKYDLEGITAALRRYKQDYLSGNIPLSSSPEFNLRTVTKKLEKLLY